MRQAVRILDHRGNPYEAAPKRGLDPHESGRPIKGRFDTQFTTDDNRRHWALADAMSIDASANWMVRRTLRMRSRYEYHNNGYYLGMVNTMANYVIGTGPRLQMMIPDQPRLNAAIEKAWETWSEEIRLGETLHSNEIASIVNGESFDLLRTNPGLDNPVKLDVFEVEADQVSSPLFGMYPSQYPDQFFDGVVLDPWGRPKLYHVLRQHPGAFGAFVIMGSEFDPWPARNVVHDYKKIRPGQQRGIPEFLPALPLFAQLRRFSGAVLGAAEVMADIPYTVETIAPVAEDVTPGRPWESVELEARTANVLPYGFHLNSPKPEQPSTTFEMFCNAILREISRCVDVPLFFASLDATQANMSSAYVVTQPFAKNVEVKRKRKNRHMNRIFDEFMTEAIHIRGFLPEIPDELPHSWRWPRINQHADPAKTATAREGALACGFGSIQKFCAEDGDDWQTVQQDNADSFGMTLDEYRKALRERVFATRGQPVPAADDPQVGETDQNDRTPEPSTVEEDD